MKHNLRIVLAIYTACIFWPPVPVFTEGGFAYQARPRHPVFAKQKPDGTKRFCQGLKYAKKERSSDGNLVNFGNADDNGANVNRWNPQNANDNIGFFLSRSVRQKGLKALLSLLSIRRLFSRFPKFFLQFQHIYRPPSILCRLKF